MDDDYNEPHIEEIVDILNLEDNIQGSLGELSPLELDAVVSQSFISGNDSLARGLIDMLQIEYIDKAARESAEALIKAANTYCRLFNMDLDELLEMSLKRENSGLVTNLALVDTFDCRNMASSKLEELEDYIESLRNDPSDTNRDTLFAFLRENYCTKDIFELLSSFESDEVMLSFILSDYSGDDECRPHILVFLSDNEGKDSVVLSYVVGLIQQDIDKVIESISREQNYARVMNLIISFSEDPDSIILEIMRVAPAPFIMKVIGDTIGESLELAYNVKPSIFYIAMEKLKVCPGIFTSAITNFSSEHDLILSVGTIVGKEVVDKEYTTMLRRKGIDNDPEKVLFIRRMKEFRNFLAGHGQ